MHLVGFHYKGYTDARSAKQNKKKEKEKLSITLRDQTYVLTAKLKGHVTCPYIRNGEMFFITP
jgi:hypothetical protein